MNKSNLIFTPIHQLIILLLLAFGLNVNTLLNQYAVDDAIVLTNNKFVDKGIKGIPEIVTQEYFKGLGTLKGNELSGGRYRPFALIAFALEHQFFGTNPMISHLINVLLFVLLIALLYQLLQAHLFKEQNNSLAFFTCLLFAVHPIHTEVIANVKSRDELIAFILLLISLINLLKNSENPSKGKLFTGLICLFLGLLTKESSAAFIIIFPLILFFFYNQPLRKSILFSFPLLVVFICYAVIRFAIIGLHPSTSNLILNAPFLYATSSQAFATKVFILFKYIWLLILPHPLSSDYSYNQIPYVGINSVSFVFSLMLLMSLATYAIFTFKSKSLFSFCILFFLINIFLVSNFILNIGAPLAERLLFQPSLAYCIATASIYLIVIKKYKVMANLVLVITLLLFSLKTISRNAEWKNNDTLYSADVMNSSNSLRTNMYIAESYLNKATSENNKDLKKEYFTKSIYYGEKAIKIYPIDQSLYLHLGSAYFGLNDYFKSADLWQQAYKIDTTEQEAKKATAFISSFLFKKGNAYFEKNDIDDAIKYYKKSTELNSNNAGAWYSLGGTYYLKKDSANAVFAWNKVKLLEPDHRFNRKEFQNN